MYQSIEEFGKLGKYTDSTFECTLYSEMLGEDIDVLIFLDEGRNLITEKHLIIINEFLELKNNNLDMLKKMVFENWLECRGGYPDDEFDISTTDPEDAWKHAGALFVIKHAEWTKARGACLDFWVPWESEHGYEVLFYNGKLRDDDFKCDEYFMFCDG